MKRFAAILKRCSPAMFLLAVFLLTGQDALALTLQEFSLFPGERVALVDYRLYIQYFYFFSIGAAALIATVLIMIGGMIWITSAGNQSRITKAKEYITQSIIGLILLMSAYTILALINPRLVALELPNAPELGDFAPCIRNKPPAAIEANPAGYAFLCNIEDTSQCRLPRGDIAAGSPGVRGTTCGDICAHFADDGSCEYNPAAVTATQDDCARRSRESRADLSNLMIQSAAIAHCESFCGTECNSVASPFAVPSPDAQGRQIYYCTCAARSR